MIIFLNLIPLYFLPTDDYIIMVTGRDREMVELSEFEYKETKMEKATTKNLSAAVRGQQAKTAKKASGHHLSSTSYNVPFHFVESGRRNQVMICEGRKYIQNNKYGKKIYWKCSKWHDSCKARAITLLSDPNCIIRRNEHNHPENDSDLKDEKDNTME